MNPSPSGAQRPSAGPARALDTDTPTAPGAPEPRHRHGDAPEPDGKTAFGVCVWYIPGRPGEILAWQGDHDMLRRYQLATHDGRPHLGAPIEPVSLRLPTLPDAMRAAGAFLAGAA